MSTFAIAVHEAVVNVATDNGYFSQQRPVHSTPKAYRLDRPYVQVLNVVVETDTYILSLVRYIPDLLEFDDLIKRHYRRVKIPFPTLAEATSKADKRRSIRQFLTSLSHHRTDSEKIQRYLQRCSVEPIVRSSSIFRDFFSVQRDEDRIVSKVDVVARAPTPDITFVPSDNVVVPQSPSAAASATEEEISSPSDSISTTRANIVAPHIIKDARQEEQEAKTIPPSAGAVVTAPKEPVEAMTEDAVVDDTPTENHDDVDKHYDFFNSLEMIKVLGKGCMGKVFLVRSRKSNELYALKSIMKELVIEQREITHTLAERDILATLSGIDHPFLAKLHASFQDTHRLYLVTSYYCGGDLATQMSTCTTFSKERTLFYAAEIIDGIGELHRLGVLYRDLKPENILLTADGHVLLTDFGLSKWLQDDDLHMTQTFCGTAEYLAPEALLGEPYSFGIDYWAYGTIIYEMLAGITPFWADNHSEMYRRVLQDPLEFPPDTDFETAEFLSGLLERDPSMRLGANGVDEIKAHMYFADISWDDVYNRRLVPPYLPNLKSSLDFSNFDPSFLEMPPVLTPVPSQTDLTADMQQVFDGYSFVDDRFLTEEQDQPEQQLQKHQQQQQPPPQQPPLVSGDDSSGWDDDDDDDDDDLRLNPKRHTMDRIDEQQMSEHRLHNEIFPPFQSARKRGSISMLSDVDSFQLDNDPTKAPEEDKKRYAKRRNTSGRDGEDEVAYAYRQQLSESLVVAEPVLITNNSSSSMTPAQRVVPDLSLASTADDVPLDDLDFGGITADLNLKLSFSVQVDNQSDYYQSNPPSALKPSSNTTSSSRRKARRFFSPLLKL